MTSYSMNEVEALAKKAARGRGFSWGLAEEAGKAVRWLEARDMGGVKSLARLLETDRVEESCPITQGALLSDASRELTSNDRVLQNIREPVLLVPFAALASSRLARALRLASPSSEVIVDQGNCEVASPFGQIAQTVQCGPTDASVVSGKLRTRSEPDETDWAILTRFAHATYAPATEESRNLGAGAGESDND